MVSVNMGQSSDHNSTGLHGVRTRFSNLLVQPRLHHTVVGFRRPLFVETYIQLRLNGVFANYRHLANSCLCPYGMAVSRKSRCQPITRKKANSLSGANESNLIGDAAVGNEGNAAVEVHVPRTGRASGAGRTRPEKRRWRIRKCEFIDTGVDPTLFNQTAQLFHVWQPPVAVAFVSAQGWGGVQGFLPSEGAGSA